MDKKKRASSEGIFYNDKVLMVLSLVVAVLLWAVVKINYSADVTRNFSDIKITMNTTFSQSGEFEAFLDEKDLYAEVEVAGKAYNLNQYALNKDDIVVEASSTYIDSAGYKVLTLSARLVDTATAADVEIVKVEPASITIYYDRRTTDTFNVEARLDNDLDSIVSDDLTVGQPVPSVSTIEVTGPATILNKLTKVYFDAQISEKDLPLVATKEVAAEISYQLDRASEGKYLSCEGINDESNPATVTIPVYVEKEVDTAVKFVNQPAVYSENPPKYKVNPDKAKIMYNTTDSEEIDQLFVGTVDFSNVLNKKNIFKFPVDEKLGVNVVDKTIEEFTVTLDMSDMDSLTLDEVPAKVVFISQEQGFSYTIDYEKSDLSAITIIGPRESLAKITAEDLQIEINVASLAKGRATSRNIEVSNISIQSDEINDCWIYGKYNVFINVTPTE